MTIHNNQPKTCIDSYIIPTKILYCTQTRSQIQWEKKDVFYFIIYNTFRFNQDSQIIKENSYDCAISMNNLYVHPGLAIGFRLLRTCWGYPMRKWKPLCRPLPYQVSVVMFKLLRHEKSSAHILFPRLPSRCGHYLVPLTSGGADLTKPVVLFQPWRLEAASKSSGREEENHIKIKQK